MGLFSDHPFEYHDELCETIEPVIEFINKYWKIQTEGANLAKQATNLSFKIALHFANMDGIDYSNYMYNEYVDEQFGYFSDPTNKHTIRDLSLELRKRYDDLYLSFGEFRKKVDSLESNDYEYLHKKALEADKRIEYYAKQCTPSSLWAYICTKIVPELNKKMAPMTITMEELEKFITPPTKKK